MIRIAFCAVALLVSTKLALAQPGGQDPLRGTEEKKPEKRDPNAVSGFTLDKLHGLPRVREPLPSDQHSYQPYSYYGGHPYYSYGSAYSYPHPFGLGGYVPPGVGRSLWGGWWGW